MNTNESGNNATDLQNDSDKLLMAMPDGERSRSPVFRSRAYSVMKRLSLGLLFTGTVGLFEAIWFSKFGKPLRFYLEFAVILQLAFIPPFMIAWGVVSPRPYSRHPSIWLVLAWIPVLLFGVVLSLEFTLTISGWDIWATPFSG